LPAIAAVLEDATNEYPAKGPANFSMTQPNVTLMLRYGWCAISTFIQDIAAWVCRHFWRTSITNTPSFPAHIQERPQAIICLAGNQPDRDRRDERQFLGLHAGQHAAPCRYTGRHRHGRRRRRGGNGLCGTSAIQRGGPQNLSNTYNQLTSANQRLIFHNQIDLPQRCTARITR
jgi:hypothetical protein